MEAKKKVAKKQVRKPVPVKKKMLKRNIISDDALEEIAEDFVRDDKDAKAEAVPEVEADEFDVEEDGREDDAFETKESDDEDDKNEEKELKEAEKQKKKEEKRKAKEEKKKEKQEKKEKKKEEKEEKKRLAREEKESRKARKEEGVKDDEEDEEEKIESDEAKAEEVDNVAVVEDEGDELEKEAGEEEGEPEEIEDEEETSDDVEAVEKDEKKKGKKKRKEDDEKDDDEDDEDDEEDESKRSFKGIIIGIIIIALLAGGGFFAKSYFTKTTVEEVSVELSTDARAFSNYFKQYITYRLRAENLMEYKYPEMSNDAILSELSTLKEGFSRISRGVGSNYAKSSYKELAEVMKVDSDDYLSTVRELRAIMTAHYDDEKVRQEDFAKKKDELKQNLRSALYVARAVFAEDAKALSSKGALMLAGNVIVEVGGGVANIMLGDFKEKVTAVSSEDLDDIIKPIEAVKLYGYMGGRVVEVGESLSGEVEKGWIERIEAEVGMTNAKIKKTRISTVMKTLPILKDEFDEQGIMGLVKTEEKSMADELAEAIDGLKGRQ